MTSQRRNRCPRCNTGFFNTPDDGSPSLLDRCQYCDYQRDSRKCPNCPEGYLERSLPPGTRGVPLRALRDVLNDPKNIRCRFCGDQSPKPACPNCGQGVLEWRISQGGEGRVIATWSEHVSTGETLGVTHHSLRESRRCSTCGYVDPSSLRRSRLPSSLLGRLGCFVVLAIVLLVVASFAFTCIVGAIS